MKVELTDIEIRLAKAVGRSRWRNNQRNGIPTRKVAKKSWQSDVDIHINGMAGEIVFAKAANLYPDLETTRPKDIDFTLPDGVTIDVKTTTYPKGNLIAPRLNGAEIYVLVTGTLPNYVIVGWATKEELEASPIDTGFKLGREHLHPIELLLANEAD